MKTVKNVVVLEESVGFYPDESGVDYTDITGMKVHIPMNLLVRLYEGTKYRLEIKGVNWEEFCSSLFEKK